MGQRTCSLEGCDRPHKGHGLCDRDLTRIRRNGSLALKVRTYWPSLPVEERFWRYVEEGDPNDCWEWTGTRDRKNYGRLLRGGRGSPSVGAHRLSLEIASGGPIPDDLFVCHRCDNPPCVNPNHLFLGTQSDNLRDMVAKGRARGGRFSGPSHPQAKLTADDVRMIRRAFGEEGRTKASLARRFGVTPRVIFLVVTNQSYRNVA